MTRRNVWWIALLLVLAVPRLGAGDTPHSDPVVARVYEHVGPSGRLLVRVVDSRDFPAGLWKRVGRLVAFRIHRRLPDGTTQADAAVYLVRTSDVYAKADAAVRNRTTNHEYVWCLLAAVVAHEAAHTELLTEVQALTAEIAQLHRCLLAGHLHSGDAMERGVVLGESRGEASPPA